MTLLALALANAGATQDEAGHFVDVEFELLVRPGFSAAEFEQANIYLGYVRLGASEMDHEIGRYVIGTVTKPLCGQVEAVMQEVTRLQAAGGLLSLVLVNASEHLRMLRDRVLEHHLDVALVDEALTPDEGQR